MNEGNSGTTAFNFKVSISGATTQTVTVNYATADGTANAPTDYQTASGTLTFAPGETSKTIAVLVNGDTNVEPNETFTVNLSGAVNATILGEDGGFTYSQWGISTDILVPADYDGDGKADIAIYRPNTGIWYWLQTTAGFGTVQWGISTDLPIPNAFVR